PDGAMALRLGADSTLDGVVINDDVSQRVLSFVAPILAEATRVTGSVSMRIGRAEIPLEPFPTLEDLDLEGVVVFEDGVFGPGPLADQLLAVIGKADRPPALRLDQPVKFEVTGGQIIQRGMTIPLGNAQVDLAGVVDFDKNIDLVASLPF